MKLGLICFANNSGLGNQTRRLAYMLRPERLLVINSTSFSKIKTQHYDWYSGFSGYRVDGFPTNQEMIKFLDGLTHVIMCENPLNPQFFALARQRGVKTYCQSNYEFCDHLNNRHLELPDKFLMPSHWHVDTMKARFGEDRVQYLAPPVDPLELREAREQNFSRKGCNNFLHIVGTLAASDRNGTLDLLKALEYTSAPFTLTIRSQHVLPQEYMTQDNRVKYVFEDQADLNALYKGYDALILPRRYGGLALTCNEAMMAGMPVIMPDISPNNELLPREWLVEASKTSVLQTRAPIDVYSTHPVSLALKIEQFIENGEKYKVEAFDLAFKEFSPSQLLPQYNEVLT